MIHPTAVIDRAARIGCSVRIGPFCVIGPEVEIDTGAELSSHVAVLGRTRIGPRTKVHSFAALGGPPQDRKYRGENGRLTIGADCVVREGVTVNPGTDGGGMETCIGDGCLLMANAHVGHDCRLGGGVVLANNVMLGGHVMIGDRAQLGGGAAVHQHVRIGEGAFVGGLSGLEGDLVPFGLATGNRARLVGFNVVGLRRASTPHRSLLALKATVAHVFGIEGTMGDRLASATNRWGDDPLVARLLTFLRVTSRRPLCRPAAP